MRSAPTFACGMPGPWMPYRPGPPPEYPPVIYQPPSCEHCFCESDPVGLFGQGPHLKCCKCGTRMAEKFVKAWFQILAPSEPAPVLAPPKKAREV